MDLYTRVSSCDRSTQKHRTHKALGVTLRRANLLRLKSKALRRGVWFKALSRIDRVLVDLTVNVVDGVHGFKLAKALWSVMKKLEDALENRVLRAVKEVGFDLARKLSLLAQSWGNRSAENWAYDRSFARFLAIIRINDSGASNSRF
jgi:hypothetical protein